MNSKQKLICKFCDLYRKINSTSEIDLNDILAFTEIGAILADIGYINVVETFNISNEYYNCLNEYETYLQAEKNRICEPFYEKISDKIGPALYTVDHNIKFDSNKEMIDLKEVLNRIKAFYKCINIDDSLLVNKTLDNGNIFIGAQSTNYKDIANTYTFEDETYVVIKGASSDKSMHNQAIVALVHELGHTIGKKSSTYGLIESTSVFKEIPSITFETMYCKEQKDNEYEYAQNIHWRLLDTQKHYRMLNYLKTNQSIYDTFSSYQYLIGEYIGFYLSNLYNYDRHKFNHLYNEIKKNIYTTNEDKIFELLLNEDDILNGDFFKQEIEYNQKVLNKYN